MNRTLIGSLALYALGCTEPMPVEQPPVDVLTRCSSPLVDEMFGADAFDESRNESNSSSEDDDDDSDDDSDEGGGGGSKRPTVPVYFHIITDTAGNDDVSDRVPAQMDVLNAAFLGKVEFELIAIDVTANDAWYNAAIFSAAELEMKAALREGGPESLNIYTGNHPLELGWAGGPWIYQNVPEFDGAVVSAQTLPGGTLAFPDPTEPDGLINYNGGDTVPHEVGHWLGLYHTFQFQPGQAGYGPNVGCSIDNDLVKDTPAENGVNYYCIERDSCTGDSFEGEDDIHNFMAYVDDDCMDSYTSGQFKRMKKQYEAYRKL